MKIGVAQISSALGLIKKNAEKHIEYALMAEKQGISTLLFPELSLSGYLLEDASKEVAITKDELFQLFIDTELTDIDLIAGYAEKEKSGIVYNSQALISIRKGIPHIAANQRKINLPTYGMFDESRHFQKGSTVERFHLSKNEILSSILICEDMWHPLLPASFLLSETMPQALFVPAASPSRGFSGEKPANLKGWEQNISFWSGNLGIYIFNSQKVGSEDSFIFSGGSMIATPDGTIIEAPLFAETIISTEIDLSLLKSLRQKTQITSIEDVAIIKKFLY